MAHVSCVNFLGVQSHFQDGHKELVQAGHRALVQHGHKAPGSNYVMAPPAVSIEDPCFGVLHAFWA